MKRTVLYYPTISIPSGDWLRQVLFYFDEVASIVPRKILFSPNGEYDYADLLLPVTDDIEFLKTEGVFRAIPPDELYVKQGWEAAHQLGEQFLAAVEEIGFEAQPGAEFVRVHRGKLEGTNLFALESKGLLRYDGPAYQTEWFLIEERTALLYMSMLAQYLADRDKEATVPGTDRREYESLVYRARNPERAFACIEARFSGALPFPRSDVPLAKILKFKRKRQSELLGYRERIDHLQQELSTANEPAAVKQVLVRFGEAQQKELQDLVNALSDAKLATVWGSFKTLIKASSPTLWGAGLAAAGLVAGVALPALPMLAGVALSGTIEVGSYLVHRRNENRVTERKSSFAYLHHAQAAGIL
jgi:hypothetical protein